MYQSTEAFGNLIQQDSRTFKSLITYDDISITDAKASSLRAVLKEKMIFPWDLSYRSM